MRLDARSGDHGWNVFDVRTLRRVPAVLWVDDESCEWCGYVQPPVYNAETMSFRTFVQRESRIRILPACRLVLLFNEVDDDEPEVSQISAPSALREMPNE